MSNTINNPIHWISANEESDTNTKEEAYIKKQKRLKIAQLIARIIISIFLIFKIFQETQSIFLSIFCSLIFIGSELQSTFNQKILKLLK